MPMRAYFGDLHNHTSYSDGSLTPTEAFAHGKAAGFDFMALTDHSYAIDDSEWANMLSAANAATDRRHVCGHPRRRIHAGRGRPHQRLSTPCAIRAAPTRGVAFCDYTPNLEAGVTVDGFYHWLSITGTQALDGAGSLAQFNHPGWINFNDWTYHPEVSPTMRLEEVGNGSGSSYVFSEDEYIRSLDYGWKLGATNNADTHSPYWGTNTDHRTGVWMAKPDQDRPAGRVARAPHLCDGRQELRAEHEGQRRVDGQRHSPTPARWPLRSRAPIPITKARDWCS